MAEEKPELPDLHIGNAAAAVCHKLSAHAVVMLVVTKDGAIAITAHGANHALANEMLSRGIHLNLMQHDEHVRQGMAGEEAQRFQGHLDTLANAAATGVVQ